MTPRRAVRLALAAVLLAAASIALVLTSEHEPHPWATIALAVPVGLAFVGAGLVAWLERPDNRSGLLMVLVGFTWFGGALGEANSPLLFSIGLLLSSTMVLGFLLHLVLAFPSGRLETRARRVTAAAGYVLALVVVPLGVLVSDPRTRGDCAECPENLFLVSDSAALRSALGVVVGLGFAVLTLATIALLVERWRGCSTPQRRSLTPVYVAVAGAFLTIGVVGLLDAVAGVPPALASAIAMAALLTVPLAFLFGLLRTRLARSALGRLVLDLGQRTSPDELRDALRRALRDPTLDVAYWFDHERWIDAHGRRVELPEDGSGRVHTLVERDGRCVAALIHDATLNEDPELVHAAAAAASLALENERLDAELRARLEELRASRARLVEAGDAERQRLERNLHDGAQQRLVTLSLRLRLAQARLREDPRAARELLAQGSEELGLALEELRELARGIHPAVLSDRGLGPAVDSLTSRAPLPVEIAELPEERLPPPVEAAAYYLIAEALTNVVKYANASGATVRVTRANGAAVVEVEDDGVGGADPARGSGLRGLADRIEALDGRFQVASRDGAGTRVRAEIPVVGRS